MRRVDLAKIVIGVSTAVLVVAASFWVHIKLVQLALSMQEGFADLKAVVGREQQTSEIHEERLDKNEKEVAEAKKEAKAKPKVVVVKPPEIIIAAPSLLNSTPVPTQRPSPRGLLQW